MAEYISQDNLTNDIYSSSIDNHLSSIIIIVRYKYII